MNVTNDPANPIIEKRLLLNTVILLSLFQAGCATHGKPGSVESTVPASSTPDTGGPSNNRADSTTPPLSLLLCKTGISNSPPASNRQVRRSSSTGCINGVSLQIAPAPTACLTSGFGVRGSRLHRGIDYQSKPVAGVVAAASGVVISSEFRQKDFGHWVVIDHGSGVYSAYAHLASVDPLIRKLAKVHAGQNLGVMGRSGNATNSIHLHYEIRRGDIAQARSYFKLKPVNPFSLPARCPAS